MAYKTKTHILENISLPSILKPARPGHHVAGTKGVLLALRVICMSPLVSSSEAWLLLLTRKKC